MKITQRIEGEVMVLLPEGRVDTETASDLDQAMQSVASAGNHKLVLDMSSVDYISSAGLRSIAAVLVKCRSEGGDVKLAGLNERVARVFSIIGFDVLISIHDTAEAAIADFSPSVA